MASAQEVEMLRRQLDELTAQMIEMRQQSSSTAMNAALTGRTEAVRTMGQSVSWCWLLLLSLLFGGGFMYFPLFFEKPNSKL